MKNSTKTMVASGGPRRFSKLHLLYEYQDNLLYHIFNFNFSFHVQVLNHAMPL